MRKSIQLRDQEISYTLRKSEWARRLRITVDQKSGVVVTLPRQGSMLAAEKFLLQKALWILRSIDYFKNKPSPSHTYGRYEKNKNKAYKFAVQKIKQFNEVYGYRIGRVNIKNQKTLWGSCSRKGSINLNYKILFLPERMAEYIVVHELCHLKEQNHSVRFWDLIAETFPDHKTIRRQLRKRDFS